VNASGVSGVSRIGSLISGYSTDMKFSGGLLYATNGRVVDPETQMLIGTFQSGGSSVAVDAAQHRAFFISNNIITAYDTDTFIKIGSVTLPVSFSGTPTSLVRWGTNGLAFRIANSSNAAENQLYIIQSALVSSNGQIPTGLQLSQSSYFTSESNSTATVNVIRTGDLSSMSSVSYSTSDGTATAGQDYSAVSGAITFAPGEASKNISIPIINDNIYESPEAFNVTLSNPTTGSTIIFPGSSVVNISDNDSRPFISMNSVTVNEPPPSSTENAVFTVQLTNPTTQTVTVNFATVNGTATAGIDYVALNGTLTFNPLETVKSVSVVIRGDGNIEPDETFSLTLSSPTNASVSTGQVTAVIRNYNSARRSRFDFDGDNKTDVSIFRPGAGEWWYLKSSNGGNGVLQFGLSSDKLTPADFTGDGKTDIAFWRPSTGEWFILRSDDFSFYSFPFGTTGDIPAPADYDGDGKSDAAVYRPSNGTWYVQNSSGSGTSIVNFGIAEDKPVAADYDGDGKADIAIFRPTDGSWWYLQSSNSQFKVFSFGLASDKPVQGDFTGDGKADIAVFRQSTGEWFIQRSENNTFFSFPFGTNGDLPVPGDYDGDGKMDSAVFRPSTSTWYLNQTTAGVGILTFGIDGDNPVPGVFVP
jgi:Calx-beta domain/FG-GAP-like repeat